MAVMLGFEALQGAISMKEAIDLVEEALAHEAAGRTVASPKQITDFEGGAAVHRRDPAAVYTPTPANREAYAREMSARLGITVTAVDTAEAAVRGRTVVAAASGSRSPEPILRGAWLAGCRLLCAVGNT